MIEIGPNQYKYENRPVFVTFPRGVGGKWHVWGPTDMIHVDTVVEVYRYDEDKLQPRHILEQVGRRLVRKRNGDAVEFGMFTFDRVVEED